MGVKKIENEMRELLLMGMSKLLIRVSAVVSLILSFVRAKFYKVLNLAHILLTKLSDMTNLIKHDSRFLKIKSQTWLRKTSKLRKNGSTYLTSCYS